MHTDMKTIQCFLTSSQKDTMLTRAAENGFDNISTYLKVIALQTQDFKISPAGLSDETPDIEYTFEVNPSQLEKIEAKAEQSGAKDVSTYVTYAALHAVVTAVVEVRSTGSFDDMLQRIAALKGK